MNRFLIKIIVLALIISLLFLLGCESWQERTDNSIPVIEILGGANDTSFSHAERPIKFQFPDDLGPHPSFRNEWWYLTGNLQSNDGENFGYQFTIFRIALSPDTLTRSSEWASSQMYMAHFALTDVSRKNFHFFQRFSRSALELAGANHDPFRVWVEDWYIQEIEKSQFDLPVIKIKARENNLGIDLQLKPIKPIVLQGDAGLSKKGERKGNASYYFSFTRLETKGKVEIDDKIFDVSGYSWFDREWSTSALSPDQVGWDWFSLQLEDSSEIMYYQIRKWDGTPSPQSQGSLVEKNGNYQKFEREEVEIQVLDHWTSPLGGKYPSGWRIIVKNLGIDCTIKPVVKNQELNTLIRYWEGSVTVKGKIKGNVVTGKGYVELTGYGDKKF